MIANLRRESTHWDLVDASFLFLILLQNCIGNIYTSLALRNIAISKKHFRLRSKQSIANMGQKTVLITGCSEGGIGDALAKTFHKKGFRVFASARNTAKVQHLMDMGLEIVQLDVTDEESIKKAVSTVKAATGGYLDFLVNNSGAGNLPASKRLTCGKTLTIQ